MTIRDIANLQKAWKSLISGKEAVTKKKIYDLCVPFRDIHGLTDRETLSLARNELTLEQIADILERSQPSTPCWFEDICEALPKEPGHQKFWSTGEEILCRDAAIADAAATFLNAIGFDTVTGYYDPAEDKAAGLEDELTGSYYINLN